MRVAASVRLQLRRTAGSTAWLEHVAPLIALHLQDSARADADDARRQRNAAFAAELFPQHRQTEK